MKNRIYLDGGKIESVQSFHDQISQKLSFPDYYGHNMDALWDCLTAWIDRDLKLIWLDHKYSEIKMGDSYSVAVSLFRDLAIEYPEFEFELA